MYQIAVAHDIKEDYPDFDVKVMHNEEEKSALSTQVSTLTEGKLSYGDFEHESGYLINKERKIAIVYPEKIIEEQNLFKVAQSEFDFSDKNMSFLLKNSESDINYMVRENNKKGEINFNGKHYSVFEDYKSHPDDRGVAILVKIDKPRIENQNKKTKKIKP